MIVWINGTVGPLRRQVAAELARRLPGVVSEPERLGQGIHAMQPVELRQSFYDDPVWAPAVASILGRMDDALDAPIVVPMLLARRDRFDEVIGGLRGFGHDVRHVTLIGAPAAASTPLRALTAGTQAESDADTAALADATFGAHVEIGDLSVPEIANAVATTLALNLGPAEPGPLRQRVSELRSLFGVR